MDRKMLDGGERWTNEIDVAIKQRTLCLRQKTGSIRTASVSLQSLKRSG